MVRPEGRGVGDGSGVTGWEKGCPEKGPRCSSFWAESFRTEEDPCPTLLERLGLELGVLSQEEPWALAPDVEVVAIEDIRSLLGEEGEEGVTKD